MVRLSSRFVLTLLAVLTVIIRVIFFQPQSFPLNKTITIQARVSTYPELKGTQQRFHIKPERQYKGFQELIVYTNRYPAYQFGDSVGIQGQVREHQIVSFPKINILGNHLNQLERLLIKLRSAFQSAIEESLPEPHASLVLGMLLGIENDIPENFEKALKSTGTIHMLVVSGFNITLVTAFVLKLAGIINRKYALLLAILISWAFVFLAGAQPPAIRAGIMTTLALTAQLFGRPAHVLPTLFLTILTLLLISPELIYSVSFQLSCAATAGIILLPNKINQALNKNKESNSSTNKNQSQTILEALGKYIKEEGATTLAAQIAVTPLILSTFGSFSLSAPLVNILVAWSVPYIMIGGLLVGLAGLVNELLGLASTIMVIPFTAFFVQTITFFSQFTFLYFENIKINPALTVGLYLILLYIIIRISADKKYTKEKDLK